MRYDVLCTALSASKPLKIESDEDIRAIGPDNTILVLLIGNDGEQMLAGFGGSTLREWNQIKTRCSLRGQTATARVAPSALQRLAGFVKELISHYVDADIAHKLDKRPDAEILIGSLISVSSPAEGDVPDGYEAWSLTIEGLHQQIIVGNVPDDMAEKVLATFTAPMGVAGGTKVLLDNVYRKSEEAMQLAMAIGNGIIDALKDIARSDDPFDFHGHSSGAERDNPAFEPAAP